MLPEILVLYCGHTLGDGVNPPDSLMTDDYKARFVRIPCSSKIEPIYLVKLFESGADGALIVACARDRCQFLFGSSCAEQRIKFVRARLDEIGLGAGRLTIACGNGLSNASLLSLAAESAAAARVLGPNPLKQSVIATR